jgi:hypothetical protein
MLRNQLQECSISRRERTGVGFYTWFAIGNTGSASKIGDLSFSIGDVNAIYPSLNHGASFELFVVHGLIDNLEGFSFDEPWPEDESGFLLEYQSQPRDLSELDDVLRKLNEHR